MSALRPWRRWVALLASPGGVGVSSTTGSFRGYGADVAVSLTPDAEADTMCELAPLPLPLLVAGWLRGAVDPAATVVPAPVPTGSSPRRCAQYGHDLAAALAEDDEPVGVLVLGDGAAAHHHRAPGYFDPRARGFDEAARTALATADADALLDLDPGVAGELLVAGREAWQAAAGALQATDGSWRGRLLYSAAPYGVGYHVALWERE